MKKGDQSLKKDYGDFNLDSVLAEGNTMKTNHKGTSEVDYNMSLKERKSQNLYEDRFLLNCF